MVSGEEDSTCPEVGYAGKNRNRYAVDYNVVQGIIAVHCSGTELSGAERKTGVKW